MFLAPTMAQEPPMEPGIVYYLDGADAKPLVKEVATQGGRANISAKVNGAHAPIRLASGKSQMFKICGVDPTRFKLYAFKSSGNTRMVVLAKVNIWIGGVKSVVSESEVALAIHNSISNCFALETKTSLADGEYGFSPAGSEDAFMFGVGTPKKK
jgi:hypothetical protein